MIIVTANDVNPGFSGRSDWSDFFHVVGMDVLLEDAPQLVINVMFMMLIQSTGSAINQVSLFFTLAMTLSALGNLAWRLVTLVRATKRDFGGGKGGGMGWRRIRIPPGE